MAIGGCAESLLESTGVHPHKENLIFEGMDTKKKVLFIIDSLVCGGAEKSLISLLSLLTRERYELYLWLRNPVGAFMSWVPEDVIMVEQPSYTFAGQIKRKMANCIYSLAWRWNQLTGKREHKAETLYKCTGWAMKVPEGSWDVVIAYQQGIPTYLVADKFDGCKKLAWMNVNIVNAGYSPAFNVPFYGKMNGIVPVSDVLHRLLRNVFPAYTDRFHVIYDILNPDTIKKLASENVRQIKTDDGKWVLVTVGRLAVQKNYLLAVEAAAELKKRGVDFIWYFIGEGSERIRIEKRVEELEVQEQVKLLGEQMNPYAFMRQADIYVQTSSFEGFGLTIAEAKILGKPVVSTNFDVVRNQLTHEKNGLIAEMSGKSIADYIYRLMMDETLRNRMVNEIKQEKNTTYLTEVRKVEQLIDA
jgi:glycosyltransferase involved in cell wall biosynthesis